MTDHKEDQVNEIEALESIYPDEIEVLETDPFYIFNVIIKPTEFEETDESASCTVKFQYVQNYPDEAPVFEITDLENLDEEYEDILNDFINEQISENLGMAMVFTIVSALQEKIAVIIEDRKRQEEEEKERVFREKEEAEQKRFEGTKVSVETFLAWKLKFEAEVNELKAQRLKDNPEPKGLSGKEMFMQDDKLDESDMIFLQSEDADVEVDESLFQDMEDLDIEDDEGLDLDDSDGAVD
ncbi:RWD domain-containing protein 1-like [Mytilus edulis]|uniref:RWD domain-containing protein 1 n=1 Tax=Mytilus edulis TaxID=6550 RepID=A0A8S3UTQ5_MYTED|nr:RWD domain-containing protein 1 [Mytilus edulis]